VRDKDFPSAELYPAWSWREISPFLKAVPEGRDALWDSVVGVYWIQKLEEEFNPEWPEHACTWLVSSDRSLLGREDTDVCCEDRIDTWIFVDTSGSRRSGSSWTFPTPSWGGA